MANSFLYIKSILRIALHINHKISSVINITPLQTSLIPLFMSGDSQPIEFLKVETYWDVIMLKLIRLKTNPQNIPSYNIWPFVNWLAIQKFIYEYNTQHIAFLYRVRQSPI